ncbi:MAG: transcriptional regulator [Pseudopedobacter saltans]|uniref:Transcriptional regulator n=1 Tax=Pseudopedobacter saltans TaxID=151895 RepID=A0A2W5E069_9SPHI|nr:MAG: transcriptional regulator [Pseudopedobacter saltans]
MIAVITGDIVKSRKAKSFDWVKKIKLILNKYALPNRWEIFRGDSFQLEVQPENAVLVCFQIKLELILLNMDARMAIGIGEQSFKSSKVTESNGPAYVFSGDCFESLQKKKLAIKTSNETEDAFWNMTIDLAMLTASRWTATTAELILLSLSNPELNQKEIATKAEKKSQSNISAALKRSGYHEIVQMLLLFSSKIKTL